jgi:peptidoglycan/LPS O-acetylase OafA/YrhL
MSTMITLPPSSSPAAQSPKTQVASRPKRELTALTGLRFFAAFSVVIYHFCEPLVATWPKPFTNLASSGYVAVSLFFLLSGFVLSYSYLGREGKLRGTRRGFWVARLARIYPAYLVAFLLAAPTNLLWTLKVNAAKAAAVKLVVGGSMVLAMLQAWTPWTAWYWNFPGWSISVEAFFYLSFPFLASRLARLKRTAYVAVMAAAYLLSLAPPIALYYFKHITGPPQLDNHLQMAVEFTPLFRLPEFILGMLLGRLYLLGYHFKPAHSRLISYASAAVLLLVLSFSSRIPHPILATCLAPLFALLIFSLASGEGLLANFLSLRPLILLGEASYGMYILQIPVSYVLHTLPPIHEWKTFGGYSFVLIAVSLFSLEYVESPLRARIRKWLGGAEVLRFAKQ